jgi:hypothetical protein
VTIAGLKQAVIDRLPDIFATWEGRGLPFMYSDVKGIVTCGTGNALFTASAAEALLWRRPDGSPATAAEVAAAYAAVKAAFPGVQSARCQALTTIRLDVSALAALVMRTIAQDWAVLLEQFPGSDAWPADAQLMLLSAAWAWGPGFCMVWDRIPAAAPTEPGEFAPVPGFGYGDKFRSLLSPPPEFVPAAQVMRDASVHEEKINPGIVPRDLAEVVMLQNAAAVQAAGADYEQLWYPKVYAA